MHLIFTRERSIVNADAAVRARQQKNTTVLLALCFEAIVNWVGRFVGLKTTESIARQKKKLHQKSGTIQFKAKRPTILANNMVITAARNTCTQCVLLALDSHVDDGKQQKKAHR